MAFNLEDYETVEERLGKFWNDNPDGRIETERVVSHNAPSDEYVFVARLFRTEADQHPVSTGWASETKTSSGFNKFACELSESSALGRALANWIYAKKGSRPSQVEMQRVAQGNQEDIKPRYGSPGSRSAAVETALRTSIKNDPWTAPKLEDPAPVAWSVDDVAKEFNAEKVSEKYYCQHGERLRKEGTSKQGKPYLGYVCTEKRKEDQCDPIWAKITANGKFYVPDADKDRSNG
jgi:hypothetical protein